MYHLVTEQFFTLCWPHGFRSKLINAEAFAAAPDARGVIKGERLLRGLRAGGLTRFSGCSNDAPNFLQLYLFESPDQSLALTVAWFVLQQKDVILGGENRGSAVVVRVNILVVDWKDRYRRTLRVRRKKSAHMQHCADWNIT
jgi:hypothetical protein